MDVADDKTKSSAENQTLLGTVERITFFNPENGFTVARFKTQEKQEPITIVGLFPLLQGGELLRCLGCWQVNNTYGRQFSVDRFELITPQDLLGIQKYLGSGLIRGLGPTYAQRIVEKFGLETLAIIDLNPEKLLSISGIGPKKLETIKTSWEAQKTIRDLLIFLQKHEITPTYAHKIFRTYGKGAIAAIEENPYRLAHEIHGIGFKSADKIAEKLGVSKESPFRIDSGLEYVFFELASLGHVCAPLPHFVKKATEMLEVSEKLIEESIERLREKDCIIVKTEGEEPPNLWLKGYYLSEEGIAKELKRLATAPSLLREIDIEKALDWVENKLYITLAIEQKEAVKMALTEKVSLLTGGPGTGKSTITKAILAISFALTKRIMLAAPTGKAAKRLSEITHKEAFTIHSLLSFDFKEGTFRKNRTHPLSCDLIIIDEASMIDTLLMYHLLQAIPSGARVVLVGDANQLPSIGPGTVLRDMIESKCLPTVQLIKIFRQAAGSKIITNAHRINEGLFPDLKPSDDFLFFHSQEPKEALDRIISLVTREIPQTYHFDPISEIQILTPMKKGLLGTENLNALLQETLNPTKETITYGATRFGVGDKVMQIKNNYEKEVFNGDIGKVSAIDREEQTLFVSFDGREVEYPFTELDELSLAYAISIHKYQGSESPAIIVPIHTTHFIMLQRNLLYTAVTRGKKLVSLVGLPKAIAIAIRNDQAKKRFTYLQQHIKNSF